MPPKGGQVFLFLRPFLSTLTIFFQRIWVIERKKGSFFSQTQRFSSSVRQRGSSSSDQGFSFFQKQRPGRSRTAVKSFCGSRLTPGPHDHFKEGRIAGIEPRFLYHNRHFLTTELYPPRTSSIHPVNPPRRPPMTGLWERTHRLPSPYTKKSCGFSHLNPRFQRLG